MTYLVFDARKASGYLFETRHRWLAHAFCISLDAVQRALAWVGMARYGWPVWDYEAALDFTVGDIPPMTEEEFMWSEWYNA